MLWRSGTSIVTLQESTSGGPCGSGKGNDRQTGRIGRAENQMDLLTNAIESIQVGVEDYQSGTRPRLLSAVRNIHAGILLLFKEALRRESPKDTNDALMMARIIPVRDARGI